MVYQGWCYFYYVSYDAGYAPPPSDDRLDHARRMGCHLPAAAGLAAAGVVVELGCSCTASIHP